MNTILIDSMHSEYCSRCYVVTCVIHNGRLWPLRPLMLYQMYGNFDTQSILWNTCIHETNLTYFKAKIWYLSNTQKLIASPFIVNQFQLIFQLFFKKSDVREREKGRYIFSFTTCTLSMLFVEKFRITVMQLTYSIFAQATRKIVCWKFVSDLYFEFIFSLKCLPLIDNKGYLSFGKTCKPWICKLGSFRLWAISAKMKSSHSWFYVNRFWGLLKFIC